MSKDTYEAEISDAEEAAMKQASDACIDAMNDVLRAAALPADGTAMVTFSVGTDCFLSAAEAHDDPAGALLNAIEVMIDAATEDGLLPRLADGSPAVRLIEGVGPQVTFGRLH